MIYNLPHTVFKIKSLPDSVHYRYILSVWALGIPRQLILASFPGLPCFVLAFSIKLNANRRTKIGEAWERGCADLTCLYTVAYSISSRIQWHSVLDCGMRVWGLDCGTRGRGLDCGMRGCGLDCGMKGWGLDCGTRARGLDTRLRSLEAGNE